MTIACITVPHFALRIAVLEQPDLAGRPLVLGSPPGARPLVRDATPEAREHGIRPGLGVREVAPMCPDALILEPHPTRELAMTTLLQDRFAELSPLVEAHPELPGCWFIDLHGSERSLGAPGIAVARLLEVVPPPLLATGGAGSGKFVARAAASRARPGSPRIVPPDAAATFLAPAPIALLPVDASVVRRLERLGFQTLGDLARLPMTALQARFGQDGRRWWELANGIDPEPVRPRAAEPTPRATLELPDPATSRDTLLIALEYLVHRLFQRPVLQSSHVRQARLLATIENGRAWEQLTTLREPGGAHRVLSALGYRLSTLLTPGPVTHLTLELRGLAPIEGRQELLPGLRSRRPRELVEAAVQLKQRFGAPALFHVVEVEPWSRIPERRLALIAFDR